MSDIFNKVYQELVDDISKQNNDDFIEYCREDIIDLFHNYTYALFYDYYRDECHDETLEEILTKVEKSFNDLTSKGEEIFAKLPAIRKKLLLDIEAIFEGDPAANSKAEIVTTYPGFFAIRAYRLAHEFYLVGDKTIARILSEYAHSHTGIDISPGATIGDYFFIDHGTGVVIGETSVIGNHCKLYQGVTLGALSLKDGRKLCGVKRHPTLLDNVVIYSGASIFGGDTIIGNNVIIGSNVEIKKSIPDNTVVRGNEK